MTKNDSQGHDNDKYTYQTPFTLTHAVSEYEKAKTFLDEVSDVYMFDILKSDITFDADYGDLPKDFSDKIESIRWSLDTADAGHITLEANTELTKKEKTYLSKWINEQHKESLGDDFKDEPFAKYECKTDKSEQEQFHISNTEALNLAVELLDNHNIPYNLDSNDRIRLDADIVGDAIEFLDVLGIDYEKVEERTHMATVGFTKSKSSLELISEPGLQDLATALSTLESEHVSGLEV